MATKVYTKGDVTYGAHGRKWKFEHPSGFSYTTPLMPGGAETAHKIAGVVNGGCKRTGRGELDNLARSNMATIFHTAAKSQSKVVR